MEWIKIALLLFISVEAFGQTSAFSDASYAQTANGDVCKDCTQIFELLLDLMTNPDLQKKLVAVLDHVCDLLPGPTSKACKEEVETILPTAITFITAFIKPAEVCKIIGLCGSRDEQAKMLQYFADEVFKAGVMTENVQPASHCSFCIFLIKTLEDLLPKERTEEALIRLLDEICHLLPPSHKDQCKAVIGQFTKAVLDAILHFATPQTICALIRECKGEEASPPVDLCALPTYRCRDIMTAARCGTMFYCQKFAWKPVKYSTP